jgi:ribosomal-protein-alanine N-acetyltransferase
MSAPTVNIRFATNSGNLEQTVAHLHACSPTITPPLHEKVNIEAYAEKIVRLAVSFEAWDGDTLIGLVAAYLNDPSGQGGFITHVSVLPGYNGQGIGGALLERCIALGRLEGFRTLELEVNRGSLPAVLLYQKFGFETRHTQGDMLRMLLIL